MHVKVGKYISVWSCPCNNRTRREPDRIRTFGDQYNLHSYLSDNPVHAIFELGQGHINCNKSVSSMEVIIKRSAEDLAYTVQEKPITRVVWENRSWKRQLAICANKRQNHIASTIRNAILLVFLARYTVCEGKAGNRSELLLIRTHFYETEFGFTYFFLPVVNNSLLREYDSCKAFSSLGSKYNGCTRVINAAFACPKQTARKDFVNVTVVSIKWETSILPRANTSTSSRNALREKLFALILRSIVIKKTGVSTMKNAEHNAVLEHSPKFPLSSGVARASLSKLPG